MGTFIYRLQLVAHSNDMKALYHDAREFFSERKDELTDDLIYWLEGDYDEDLNLDIIEGANIVVNPSGRAYVEIVTTEKLNPKFRRRIEKWILREVGDTDVFIEFSYRYKDKDYEIYFDPNCAELVLFD